jgi:hypothetical protein
MNVAVCPCLCVEQGLREALDVEAKSMGSGQLKRSHSQVSVHPAENVTCRALQDASGRLIVQA